MSWLALYLPRLACDRLIRCGRASADQPLAVYAKQTNAYVLTGVDARAAALGLRTGQALADARAIYPALACVEAEPEADAAALDAIAAWCGRFTPVVALDPPDGLFLDISGCGHLFGGDGPLRDEIVARLAAQGFAARAAIAATPGAAWGLARYGRQASSPLAGEVASEREPEGGRADTQAPACLHAPHPLLPPCGGGGREAAGGGAAQELALAAPSRFLLHRPPPVALRATPSPQGGGLAQCLASLPIEALRLDEDAAALLRRLGLKTIGQLIAAPRAPFAARAGQRALRRLDQALGRASEALSPRRPPPPVFALRRFLEPLFSVDAMLEAGRVLCEEIAAKLELRGAGARACALHLFGVDGRDRVIEIGLSHPERDVKTLMRLLREKLDRAAENLDAEFGIEAARLDVVALERIEASPRTLVADENVCASPEKIAGIVDVLSARLGPKRVLAPKLRDAHAPERAGGWRDPHLPPCGGGGERMRAGGGVAQDMAQAAPLRFLLHRPPPVALRATPSPQGGGCFLARPLTLFSQAQPIDAIATVPDGPPIRFRWRRVLREVARAEGPERIAGDWLKREPMRDYYRVEDKQGRRYWLYREGLYGEDEAPRWFVHGMFA